MAVAVLSAVEAGLADPTNHYLIDATAFESPDGPVLLDLLHLQARTTHDVLIEAHAFTCSVLLEPLSSARFPSGAR